MAKATCSVEDCDEPVHAHGVCQPHGYRLKKYGDPLGAPPPRPSTCSIEGCGKPAKSRGWCGTHYARWQKHGDPLISAYGQPKPPCSIEGCESVAYGRGWCSKHWQRWRRYGDPLLISRRAPSGLTNEICLVEGCDKPRKALGWCAMHYERWQDHGSTDLPPRQKKPSKRCAIKNCRRPRRGREWCDMHYQRWRKWGDPSIRATLLPVPPCSVADCGNRSSRVGVCQKHYRDLRAKFMVEQDGKCAICHVPEGEAKGGKLHLDHNHAASQPPRSLLCHHCNVGIGLFMENPDVLRAAARYLEDHAEAEGQLPLFAA